MTGSVATRSRTAGSEAMGLMGEGKRLFAQAKQAAKKHPHQVTSTVEKAEDALDSATGGKYHDKIEAAEDHAERYLEK